MKRLGRFSNQRGLGLVPFLVGTAVVGIMIAGMSSSVLTMLRSQISVAASTEAELLVDQLQAALSHEVTCSTVLANTLPDNTPMTMSVRLADQDVTLSEGAPVIPGYSLVQLRMVDDTPPAAAPSLDVPDYFDGPDHVDHRRLRVTIQLQKTSDGIVSPVSLPRSFYLDANVKRADGRVKSCAAQSIASKSCAQQGGIWNPTTDVASLPAGNRCVSNLHCQYGGSYSTAAAPAGFGNPYFGGAYDCDASKGFLARQTGSITLATISGKQLYNSFVPIYSCLRCAQGLANNTVGGNIVAQATGGALTFDQELLAAEAEAAAFDAQNANNSACTTALRSSGRYSCTGSDPCGTISPPSGNTCDPTINPSGIRWSQSSSCMDMSDPLNPIPMSGYISCTCPISAPKPPSCP